MLNGKSHTRLAASSGLALACATWLAGSCAAQAVFRGDPAHSGVYAGAGPHALGGVAWNSRPGGRVLSSPVFDRGAIYFGSDDQNVYCRDAETGVQKWKFADTRGGRLYTRGRFRRSRGRQAMTGTRTRLTLTKGTLRWKFKTGGERRFEAKGLHGNQPANQTFWDPWDMFLSSPVIGQGAVFFGSGDGNVYALDQWTGAVRWKFKTGDVVHSSPAYEAGTIYIGSWDSYLYALEAATGLEKWRFKTGEDATATTTRWAFRARPPSPAAWCTWAAATRTCTPSTRVAGKRSGTSAPREAGWSTHRPSPDGMVLFGTSDSSLFHAWTPRRASPSTRLQDNFFLFSSPAVAGDVVYIGKMNGGLEALDLKTGKQLWEFQTDASKANGNWFLKADRSKNDAMLFRPPTTAAWRAWTGCSTWARWHRPRWWNGKVYFGSTDGYLYALK
jgi:outer membrane protein assembly factor BamB